MSDQAAGSKEFQTRAPSTRDDILEGGQGEGKNATRMEEFRESVYLVTLWWRGLLSGTAVEWTGRGGTVWKPLQ